MFAGDKLNISLNLKSNTQTYLTEQSATKVHPMTPGTLAEVNCHWNIEEGAMTEFVAEPLILYRDSTLKQIKERTCEISGSLQTFQLELLQSLHNLRSVILDIHDNECPTAFCLIPVDQGHESRCAEQKPNRGGKVITFLKDIAQFLVDATKQDPNQVLMTKVEEIYQKYSENFKMYLVCECCYEPQESAPWPVTVSKEKEEGKKILPKLLLLARRTLTAAAVVSTAAKVC